MDIHQLILAYRAAATEAVSELRSAYPSFTQPLETYSAGIPQSGTLPSGRTFRFHGIGCLFEKDGRSVDVDFDEAGRDGFDAWRLWLFSEHVLAERPTRDEINLTMAELERNGEIEKADQEKRGHHLYFPKSDFRLTHP